MTAPVLHRAGFFPFHLACPSRLSPASLSYFPPFIRSLSLPVSLLPSLPPPPPPARHGPLPLPPSAHGQQLLKPHLKGLHRLFPVVPKHPLGVPSHPGSLPQWPSPHLLPLRCFLQQSVPLRRLRLTIFGAKQATIPRRRGEFMPQTRSGTSLAECIARPVHAFPGPSEVGNADLARVQGRR